MTTIHNVVLPNLGFGMEEGRLIAWLARPGEVVKKGQPIAEIESDKANVELEATADGVLSAPLVTEGETTAVGAVLAHISASGSQEAIPVSTPGAPANAGQATQSADYQATRLTPVARRMASEHGLTVDQVPASGTRVTRADVEAVIAQRSTGSITENPQAAPAVRRLARELGIDLRLVPGTGQHGRIRRQDVEAAIAKGRAQPTETSSEPVQASASSPAAASTDGRTVIELTPMRLTIGRRLSQSVLEAPHFFTTAELDLTDALAALPDGIGVNAVLSSAVVGALQDVPDINATFENGTLYHYDHVNLAIAVALSNGLMTPVLHHADDYSLSGLASRIRDLVTRTREKRLKPEELSGGTFTISNLGVIRQVEHFTAIINPPQVAILALGAAKQRAVAYRGGIHIRTTCFATLSADHRFVDGMIAAQFLAALDQHIQSAGKA
jgi:pyruvate dehydrogenase E2 component (dihydrolipoamide acetyltransferase)